MAVGDRPTTFDATAYAFATACGAFPVASPPRDFVAGDPKLAAYRRHVEATYYPAAPAS